MAERGAAAQVAAPGAGVPAAAAAGAAGAGRSRPVTGAVTLKQVAAAAEVSLATASRVLHHSGGREVRAALVERVQTAAERLGYVSNPHAQALARARSGTVGLIVHEVTDPYFAAIASGAMHAAHASGVMVMLAATFRDPGLELDYLSRLRAQGARGVLLAGSGSADPEVNAPLAAAIDAFQREGGRVVAIGARPEAAVDAVVPANAGGMRLAVRHLAELGHTRIGVVSGPGGLLTVRERLSGLPADAPEPVPVVEADFTREGGRRAAFDLLARHPEITAVIALNDLMAAGVLAAARQAGQDVPRRLSVVGFDDVPFAADLSPTLTTVRLPLEEIGRRAMELLLEQDEAEPDDPPRTIPVEAELVRRGSTAPPV
ncbi:LacI family DNA-binding transcriptional regulator [Actinospica durhamensis]|uniref:LacI family DNA-binding transcriptional regulator n=1 Tax=Actinospica durhamensis TaxID=1508375 RepID=UPI001BA4499E|nr:LacI family DNA-binding transcriptional regulator [Actinospica durhamensis]